MPIMISTKLITIPGDADQKSVDPGMLIAIPGIEF